MSRKKDPEKAEISLIMIQMKQIQGFREEIWKKENKRKELPKKLLKTKEMTDRCLKRVKICNGKVYPKKIPKALYNFGDTYDTIIEQARYLVAFMDADETPSESDGTSSDKTKAVTNVAASSPSTAHKSSKSTPSAGPSSSSVAAIGKSNDPVAGDRVSASFIKPYDLSAAGPSSSTSFKDRDDIFEAGPSCSVEGDHCVPSASGESSTHNVSNSVAVNSSQSSEDESVNPFNSLASCPWFNEGGLPINAGKNKTINSDSSESEHSNNEHFDFAKRLERLNINTWPFLEKKKKESDNDESDNMLASDESDYSSDDDFETTDEDSPRYQQKLIKYRMKDILKTGYERIRNEMGKTEYQSIRPERRDNDFTVFPEVNPITPDEKPIFDSEGKAIIDLENASEFQRFVVLEFPNIPSNDEDNLEYDEKFIKWAAELDKKCADEIRKKSQVKKRVKKANSSDESCTSSKETILPKHKYSNLDKSPVKSKTKQPKEKKVLCVSSDEEEEDASKNKVDGDCVSWLVDMVRDCNEFYQTHPSGKALAKKSSRGRKRISSIKSNDSRLCKTSAVKQKIGQTRLKRMPIKSSLKPSTSLSNGKGQISDISDKSSPRPSTSTSYQKGQFVNKSSKLSPLPSTSVSSEKGQISMSEKSSPKPSNQRSRCTDKSEKSSPKSLASVSNQKGRVCNKLAKLSPKSSNQESLSVNKSAKASAKSSASSNRKGQFTNKSVKSNPVLTTAAAANRKHRFAYRSLKSSPKPSTSVVSKKCQSLEKIMRSPSQPSSSNLKHHFANKIIKACRKSPRLTAVGAVKSVMQSKEHTKLSKPTGSKSSRLSCSDKSKELVSESDSNSSVEFISSITKEETVISKAARVSVSPKKLEPKKMLGELSAKSSNEENLSVNKLGRASAKPSASASNLKGQFTKKSLRSHATLTTAASANRKHCFAYRSLKSPKPSTSNKKGQFHNNLDKSSPKQLNQDSQTVNKSEKSLGKIMRSPPQPSASNQHHNFANKIVKACRKSPRLTADGAVKSFATEKNYESPKSARYISQKIKISLPIKPKRLFTTRKQTKSSKQSASSEIRIKPASKSEQGISTNLRGRKREQNSCKPANDLSVQPKKSKVSKTKERVSSASDISKSVKKRLSSSDPSGNLVVRSLRRSKRSKKD